VASGSRLSQAGQGFKLFKVADGDHTESMPVIMFFFKFNVDQI